MAGISTESIFYISIDAVFKGWTALQLAVEHSFGGGLSRAKARWFVEVTEQWFKDNNDIDSYELEDFLAEIMSSEFNSIVDDNSLAEVATKICRFYDLIQQGRLEELNSKLDLLKKSAAVSSSQRGQEQSDDDEEEMDIGEQNVLSHINALELDQSQADSSSAGANNTNGATSGGDNNEQEEEEDGWTTVTKGGRQRKGK